MPPAPNNASLLFRAGQAGHARKEARIFGPPSLKLRRIFNLTDSSVRSQEAEDRRQRTEDGRQRAERVSGNQEIRIAED